MHSQTWGLRNRAILVLTLLVVVGSWVGAASGQNSTNSASVAKPVLPDSTIPAKSGQPAAPVRSGVSAITAPIERAIEKVKDATKR